MTIAERIRLYRQQKGLSQAELAEKSQVNNKSLSRYELGSSIPPADVLKNIADALGISSDALLNDDIISIKDKDLFQKFEVIQEMNDEDKAIVTRFLDLTIRDFRTKQAYAKN
jgi:transcriptional regulator with XRE-family HTH domain